MDRSKIKNLIITLLLIVNVSLLVLVIGNISDSSKAESFKANTLRQLFSERGMEIAPDIDLSMTLPNAVLQSRNLKTERKMISSLLGSSSVEDKGGNIMFYSGEVGTANFRATGDFEILLSDGDASYLENPVASAKKILKQLGLSYSKVNPILDVSGSNPIVTLTCTYGGNTIFNTNIKFAFISTNDALISGRRPLDSGSTLSDKLECSDAATALMRFLDHINKSGQICSEIRAVQVGYLMDSPAIGECELIPTWKIATDTGDYYISGLNGKSQKLEDFSK